VIGAAHRTRAGNLAALGVVVVLEAMEQFPWRWQIEAPGTKLGMDIRLGAR
jgi:hypothetical protein